MLIIFKSRAAGDVIMFGEVGKKMLEIMGKDKDDAKGIITVEQLPEAISALRGAIEADKAARQAAHSEQDEEEEPQDTKSGGPLISFSQRAIPLLELLQYAAKDGVPVTWGV